MANGIETPFCRRWFGLHTFHILVYDTKCELKCNCYVKKYLSLYLNQLTQNFVLGFKKFGVLVPCETTQSTKQIMDFPPPVLQAFLSVLHIIFLKTDKPASFKAITMLVYP